MILMVDVETGGLDPSNAALLEIGGVLLTDELKEVGKFQCLVKPRIWLRLEPDALRVSGLTQDHLRDFGVDEDAAIVEFQKWACQRGKPMLAGWNVWFDVAFLKAAFRRCMVDWPFSHRLFDVQSVWQFARLVGGGKDAGSSLEYVAEKLFCMKPLHRALEDAQLTLRVLEHLTRFYGPSVTNS